MEKIILYFDGSCTDTKRDGDLGLGYHANFEGEEEGSLFKYAVSGGIGTNNEAEYKAMIAGLEELIKRGLTHDVLVIGDSELIINQVTKVYACREHFLRKLLIKVMGLIKQFDKIEFKHVHREYNQLADELSKQGVNRTLTDYYNYKF